MERAREEGPESETGRTASSSPGFRAGAVVVAAGNSTRMQGFGSTRKPWLHLAGASLLEHACRGLLASPLVSELVLVVHADDMERAMELAEHIPIRAGKAPTVILGGRERCDSVANGIDALTEATFVAVHDAARPLVLGADVTRVLEAAHESSAALLAEPVTDTLKRSEDGKFARGTVDREGLWKAQTPQAFARKELRELLQRARVDAFVPTDEASLWERYVGPVALVECRNPNFKITHPHDLEWAEAVLAARGPCNAETGARI